MAKQILNLTDPGDTIPVLFKKINDNFTELFSTSGTGTTGNCTDINGNLVANITLNATNAVQRTINSKFNEFISVKDFGAKGDGIADDTAAIKSAITYINSKSGGVLHFPKGVYLTKEIVINSSTILDGNTSTIKAAANQNYIFRLEGSNITIENFVFDCANLTHINPIPIDEGLKACAIYIRVGTAYSKNIIVQKNRFINISMLNGDYHAIGFNSADAVVSDNYVDQCGGDCLNFNGGIALVTNNHVRNVGDGGIAFNNGARGTINGNYLYHCMLGVGSGPEGSIKDTEEYNTVQILNNTFDSCLFGVNMGWFSFPETTGPSNIQINNNIFFNCKVHGIRYDGHVYNWVTNGSICNNVFYSTGSDNWDGYFATEAHDISLFNCSNMVVSNNIFRYPRSTNIRYGLMVVSSMNLNISNNIFKGEANLYTATIYFNNSNNSIVSGNSINDTKAGIYLSGDTFGNNISIHANNISNFSEQGIYCATAASNLTITNNKFSTNSTAYSILFGNTINQVTCNYNIMHTNNIPQTIKISNTNSNLFDVSFNTMFGKGIVDHSAVTANKRFLNNW